MNDKIFDDIRNVYMALQDIVETVAETEDFIGCKSPMISLWNKLMSAQLIMENCADMATGMQIAEELERSRG